MGQAERVRLALWGGGVATRAATRLTAPDYAGVHRVCLPRHGDGKADGRITAVVEVISIVVVDIDIVGVIPIFRPVFRIWIDQQEREAAVEETRISHIHYGAGSHAEEVLAAETEIEAILGDVVPAVTSALLPGAMVGRPPLGATLPPGIVRLPTAAML